MLRLLRPNAALRGAVARSTPVQLLCRSFSVLSDPSEDRLRLRVLMELQDKGSELLERRLHAAHRQVIFDSQALWKRRAEVLAGAPLTQEELDLPPLDDDDLSGSFDLESAGLKKYVGPRAALPIVAQRKINYC